MEGFGRTLLSEDLGDVGNHQAASVVRSVREEVADRKSNKDSNADADEKG